MAQPNTVGDGALRRIAAVAWLAIALGLAIQAAVVAVQALSGAGLPGVEVLAAAAQTVTWSVVVCVGVAVGTIIMRSSAELAGVIGLVCAPLALGVARGAQRGMNELLGVEGAAPTAAVLVVAAVKAVQYGFLGYMLARLVRSGEQRVRRYLALGALTAAVFGSLVVVVSSLSARGLAPAELAGLAVSELLFPVGCAMVVYTVQAVAQRARPAG